MEDMLTFCYMFLLGPQASGDGVGVVLTSFSKGASQQCPKAGHSVTGAGEPGLGSPAKMAEKSKL